MSQSLRLVTEASQEVSSSPRWDIAKAEQQFEESIRMTASIASIKGKKKVRGFITRLSRLSVKQLAGKFLYTRRLQLLMTRSNDLPSSHTQDQKKTMTTNGCS